MSRVLVIRLSSFGDAAMLVPVISSVASAYPQDRFTVLTRSAFTPLFDNLGFNINTIPFDPKKKHRGYFGLLRLVRTVTVGGFSHVVDEHDVLRTKVLRYFLTLSGSKVRKIDKGRDEKQKIISSKDTSIKIPSTFDRYFETFEKAGFPAKTNFSNILDFVSNKSKRIQDVLKVKEGIWIGIAPFAKHKGKIYPTSKMENIVRILTENPNFKVLLFGAGDDENIVLSGWAEKYPNVWNAAGQLKLSKELSVISQIDVMITMDSANMHLASLVETPVISIWGATHPSLGFYGFKQDPNNAVQIDLECRPCSTFGDLPCARGDYACLERIDEQSIIDKVNEILDKKSE